LAAMSLRSDLETVALREARVFLVAAGVGQSGLVFLVVDVVVAFEEQEREDVGLEVSSVHGAPQDVGRLPEMGFKL